MDGGPEFPSDEQLIAWHDEDLTGQALAEREGIEPKQLYRAWDRLRRLGLIARGGRSGTSGAMMSPEYSSRDGDGRPTVGWFEDLLLERLRQVHGEPRWDLVDLTVKKKKREGGRQRAV